LQKWDLSVLCFLFSNENWISFENIKRSSIAEKWKSHKTSKELSSVIVDGFEMKKYHSDSEQASSNNISQPESAEQ
jgi:hypothetical protein